MPSSNYIFVRFKSVVYLDEMESKQVKDLRVREREAYGIIIASRPAYLCIIHSVAFQNPINFEDHFKSSRQQNKGD